MGLAAIIGALFVPLHIITIIITCVVAGFNWGMTA